MFESLAEADPASVRRWEAPRIGGGRPPLGPRSASAPPGGTEAVAAPTPAPSEKGSPDVDPDLADGSSAGPEPTPDDGVAVRSPEPRRDGEPNGERAGGADDAPVADALRRELATEAAGLLGALARERDARDALLEDELIALARAMARLVVRRELELDGDLMRGMVREALDRLPRLTEAPRVRLHPIDAAVVDVPDGLDERVVVVADETLARGDCRIESGPTLIDAGIDAWMECIGVRHGLCPPAVPSDERA